MRVERGGFPSDGAGVMRFLRRSVAVRVAAASLFLWGCHARQAAAQDQPEADPSQADIDAFVRKQMREQRIPGLSLAVTIDNELIFTKGYGMGNVELRSPAVAESVYEVASLTKQFVAVAVLLLAQDGKLSLDDPVSRRLPEAPPGVGKNHPAPPPDPHVRHPRLRRRRPAPRSPARVHRGRIGQDRYDAADESSRPACAGTTATRPT